jgi:hypothetical protein
MRDGRCCERVTAAIRAGSSKVVPSSSAAAGDVADWAPAGTEDDDVSVAEETAAIDEAIVIDEDAQRLAPGADPAADGHPVEPVEPGADSA